MTTQAFRTMVVDAANADLARQICAALAPSGGAGMFSVGLSPTGQAPATHYVSTGYIDADFAELMPLTEWFLQVDGVWTRLTISPGAPDVVAGLCAATGLTVSEAEVEAMFAVADVTEEEPFAAFDRLGLQMVQPTE